MGGKLLWSNYFRKKNTNECTFLHDQELLNLYIFWHSTTMQFPWFPWDFYWRLRFVIEDKCHSHLMNKLHQWPTDRTVTYWPDRVQGDRAWLDTGTLSLIHHNHSLLQYKWIVNTIKTMQSKIMEYIVKNIKPNMINQS